MVLQVIAPSCPVCGGLGIHSSHMTGAEQSDQPVDSLPNLFRCLNVGCAGNDADFPADPELWAEWKAVMKGKSPVCPWVVDPDDIALNTKWTHKSGHVLFKVQVTETEEVYLHVGLLSGPSLADFVCEMSDTEVWYLASALEKVKNLLGLRLHVDAQGNKSVGRDRS